jgi:hypothetical protein
MRPRKIEMKSRRSPGVDDASGIFCLIAMASLRWKDWEGKIATERPRLVNFENHQL